MNPDCRNKMIINARKLVKMRRRLEEMPYCKFTSMQLLQFLLIGTIEFIIIGLTLKVFDLQDIWIAPRLLPLDLPFIRLTLDLIVAFTE